METLSSDEAYDGQSEPSAIATYSTFSYSFSADVSDSECYTVYSGCRDDLDADPDDASSSSPPPPPPLLWEDHKPHKPDFQISEVEMMKERFGKLLLGEDMSGGGKGVCTALAISNAITNLSATVFGELWRLEPLAPQKRSMWYREMEWILSVSDFIVELVPSLQEFPGGGTYEIMVPHPRSDLYMNLPALKKLDAMLLAMLDTFHDREFCYVDRSILAADAEDNGNARLPFSGRHSLGKEEKWWLPCARVPSGGLSCQVRKKLQQCRDFANQILKAAMAINSSVLAEMEIPDAYMESLPKNGKSCLGDTIYSYITSDQFSPECLLDCLDLSSELHALEIANRIEAAVHVWNLKDQKKRFQKKRKPLWGGKVMNLVNDAEKSHLLAQRADSLLQILRLRHPGLPQTILDMSKIQYNKDVGKSILESYSRVMESLAFNILARIDDVINVDDATKQCAIPGCVPLFGGGGLHGPSMQRLSSIPFSNKKSPYGSPFSTPLLCSSPCRIEALLKKNTLWGQQDGEIYKQVSTDAEKAWSLAGNLGARREMGDAPERD